MLTITQAVVSLVAIASLATACTTSQPLPDVAPSQSPGVASTPAASSEPAPHVDDGRCTEANLEPIRAAIERSCDLRPEFRGDCLALYAEIPLVGKLDPDRAADPDYCRLERPDATTLILHHRRREPSCMTFAVKFNAVGNGWKLASTEVDKTCEREQPL
jgi:hypothetical protein